LETGAFDVRQNPTKRRTEKIPLKRKTKKKGNEEKETCGKPVAEKT